MCETDWEAGQYYNSGIDFAAALTTAVGPIQGIYYVEKH